MSIAAAIVDCWRHIAGSPMVLQLPVAEEVDFGFAGHIAAEGSGWRMFGRRHWHRMRHSQPWWGKVKEVVVSSQVGYLYVIHFDCSGISSSLLLRGRGNM